MEKAVKQIDNQANVSVRDNFGFLGILKNILRLLTCSIADWILCPLKRSRSVTFAFINFHSNDAKSITNSMEQTSWNADRRSASQEIPRPLCNWKVYYRVHKILLMNPITSQINPVLTISIILFSF
jgi:hypothetical protein